MPSEEERNAMQIDAIKAKLSNEKFVEGAPSEIVQRQKDLLTELQNKVEVVDQHVRYEDFAKIDLRVATIVAAESVPKADKLVKLTVDAGDPQPRTIVAGIKLSYIPEHLVGSQIIIVANLEPRKLKGIESHGMLLAAKDDVGLSLLTVNAFTKAGTKVG